jgi:hypothetical protein
MIDKQPTAYEVPFVELLESVPNNSRLWVDFPEGMGSTHFPVGHYCHKAAAELRRLHQSEREGWRYVGELEQERKRLSEVNAELVEAVKAALSDDQPYIERCKAALAKATGENNG